MTIKKIITLASLSILCLLTLSPNLEAKGRNIDITIAPDKAEDYVIEEKATFDIEMTRRNRPANIKLKQIEATFPNEDISVSLTKVSKGKFKYISEGFEETGEKTLAMTVRTYGAVKSVESLERAKERLEKRIEKLEERKENTNNERLKRILDRLIAKCQRSIQKIEAKIEKIREKGIIGEASLTINVIPIAPPPEVPESGHIYGNVYDSVTELPIYEVVIIVEGIEGGVSTDEEGRFRFPISEFEGDFRDAKLLIQKEGYISVTRNISVVSERDVSVGDIYLKEVDPVVTEITPAGGEATDSTETVKLIFPPDAVSEPVDIVITPYEEEKELPEKLPLNTGFLTGISVQDGGATFTQPVTVELPNDKGFPPGTLIPIGRYYQDIEEWVHETMAVVNEDGTKIVYQTTQFSNHSAGVSTKTEDGGAGVHGDKEVDKAPDDPFQPEPGVYAGLRMGNLTIEHKLPSIKCLGKIEALNFYYQTETVNPRPRVSLELRCPSGGVGGRPIPETLGFDISIGDENRHVVFESQPGWYKQSYMFDARDGDGNLLPTGSYPYSANTSNDYDAVYCLTDEFGGPPLVSTGIPTEKPVSIPMVAPGRVEIQNETDSPFGAGWSIEGLQRMHFDPDGTILLTNGDGSMDIFAAGEEVAKGFGIPAYIAISPEEDIIVTDPFISQMTEVGKSEVITVVRISPDGTKTKVVDLERPTGIVYDAFGNLYIASARFPKYENGIPIPGTFPTILRIDPLGGTTELPCPAARPGALAIDALNNLYVADLIMGRIYKITPLGQVSIFAKGFQMPGEMAFDTSGNLYVANGLKSGISRITPSGEKTVLLRDIKKAGGLTIAPDGKILVTGIEKGVIYRVDAIAETYEVIAKGFMHPAGIVIKGNEIIVGNASHGVISKIGINGEIKGYIGPSTDYSILTKNIAEETYTRKNKYGAKTIFNKDGLQIKTIDRNNNTTFYAYIDANGDGKVEELSAITLPTGQNYTFIYNASGKLSSITDPANRVTQFAIDGENNLTQITNPDGTTRQFSYNPENHLVLTKTNERGNIAEYTYDEKGKITQVILPERDVAEVDPGTGEVTITRKRPMHTYDPSIVKGNTNDLPEGVGTVDNPAPTVVLADITDDYTDQKGNQIIYKTDRYGKIIEKTDALGNFTKTDRDRSGDAREITRANGSIVEMSYDEKGNLLTSRDEAIDATTTFTYESDFNQVTSITDSLGNTTSMNYDPSGNPVKITDAEGNETIMIYDSKGLLVSTMDAKGTTTYTYDGNGNLAKIIDALNNETSFTYDDAGNMVSTTDAKDNMTTYEYDQMNRLLKLTDNQGNITSYEYDQAGNRTKVTDPKGNATIYEYNEMNQLVKVTDAEDNVTTYAYDENDNRSSITDARSNTTTYAYNEVNRLIRLTDPLSKVSSYTYNEMGRIISTTDANSNTTNYAYDLLSRLTQTTYPDTSNVSFTYNKAGKRLSMTDAQGMTVYAYDNLNHLTSVIASGSETISYTYDALGNRTSMTNQDGGITAYEYNSLNGLIKLTDPSGKETTYEYDTVSNLTKTSYPNNTQADYTFDNLNRLISLTNSSSTETISSYIYDYDQTGMKTKVTLDNGDYINYGYDALNQLTSEIKKDPLNTIQYSYNYGFDNVGNRLSMTKDGVTTNYSYNQSNQLLSSTDGITYSYDNNGNLISKTDSTGTANYSWDYENRLIGIEYPDATQDIYTYDGVGKRIRTNENGLIKNYLYDGLNVIIEQDNSGMTTASYVRGLGYGGGIGSIISANGNYYYYDSIGNVVNIADNAGNITKSFVYDAYGNILNGAVPSPHGFSTKEYSNRSGLINFGKRLYDPTVGRFISEDTYTWRPDDPRILATSGHSLNLLIKYVVLAVGAKNPQLQHPYVYCRNNPVNYIDPWGLCIEDMNDEANADADLNPLPPEPGPDITELAEAAIDLLRHARDVIPPGEEITTPWPQVNTALNVLSLASSLIESAIDAISGE